MSELIPQDVSPGPEILACEAPCANGIRFFTTDIEYLLYFFEEEKIPAPLISNDPLAAVNGVGALPAVSSPSFNFDQKPLSGGRVTLGYWEGELDPIQFNSPPQKRRGVQIRADFFGERSITFGNDTEPLLARPFFDLNNRRESVFLVGAPGVATGNLFGSASIDSWGLEANGVWNVYNNAPGTSLRIDVLAGYRYQNFDTRLIVNSQSVFAQDLSAFPAIVGLQGNRLDVTDHFHTENDFHGAQVGAKVDVVGDFLVGSFGAKIAYGGNNQQLMIAGNQVRTAPDGSQTVFSAGLLALPSNSGKFTRTRSNLIFELGTNVTVLISRHLSFNVGYVLIGWGNVIRSVGQVDRVLDITQIPNFPSQGATPTLLGRPGVPFREESLLIHGLRIGANFSW